MVKRFTRFLLPGLLLLFTEISSATNYYVSPTGSSTASGTIGDPLSFTSAIGKALKAGDSLILRDGMYSLSTKQTISKSGNATNYLHIVAFSGENPVLDFRNQAYSSSNPGVSLSGSYVHMKGITFQGAGDNGMIVTGSNNFIENCTFRWNCDSGLQMKTGSDNLILNCDSYENFDYQTGGMATPDFGGNADGFADKQYTNTGTNTYRGCRSWRNSDDGWDSYQKIGNTKYENSWCYMNGPASYDMSNHIRFNTDKAWFDQFASTNYVIKNYGNGNGFKLGGAYTQHNATLTNCVSVGNKVKGFDQNNNGGIMTLYNCTGYQNNPNYGFSNGTYGDLIVKNSASLDSYSTNKFSSKTVVQNNNTWNPGFSCTAADFVSLDHTQLLNNRESDGSLPEITLLHLNSTSGMIDQGVDVGLPFLGFAPDLGAFEYQTPSGVKTAYLNDNVKIYPNPVVDKAIISLNANVSETLIVKLFDITGKLILEKQTAVVSGMNRIELDVSSLKTGNYICVIKGKQLNSATRLLK